MRMLGSRVRPADLSIAKVQRRADPFYLFPEWRETRARIFARDGHRCVVPGCGRRAIVCSQPARPIPRPSRRRSHRNMGLAFFLPFF